MKPCLICRSPVEAFISFGKMPLGNGFLLPEQFASEYFFDLEVGFCRKCGMVQLLGQPERERMFHERYAFFSGTSAFMARHFREFAESVMKNLPAIDPFVVEIGSNDGIMLRNFAEAGIRHLGIEPSANVAQAAVRQGIRTVVDFFGADLARKIVAEHGQADAFLAANVVCHIPYLHDIVQGIRILLKPSGIFMFEEPYLGDVIEKTSYDQIYDEHTFLFSITSLDHMFERVRHGDRRCRPPGYPRGLDAVQCGEQGGKTRLEDGRPPTGEGKGPGPVQTGNVRPLPAATANLPGTASSASFGT